MNQPHFSLLPSPLALVASEASTIPTQLYTRLTIMHQSVAASCRRMHSNYARIRGVGQQAAKRLSQNPTGSTDVRGTTNTARAIQSRYRNAVLVLVPHARCIDGGMAPFAVWPAGLFPNVSLCYVEILLLVDVAPIGPPILLITVK